MSSKCGIIILFLHLYLINFIQTNDQLFLHHEIVPDVLSASPGSVLKVTFPNGIEVILGNQLYITQVAGVPALEWTHSADKHYTVVFCDADAPSRSNPEARSFLHWLVVNIPGDDVTAGSTLTSILNSHPEPGTGLHRYLFLVYEQPSVIDFEEQSDDSFERRYRFSPEQFASKYNFGSPIAGNFYQTENLEDTY